MISNQSKIGRLLFHLCLWSHYNRFIFTQNLTIHIIKNSDKLTLKLWTARIKSFRKRRSKITTTGTFFSAGLRILGLYSSSIRFPPNGFKHYFTLFSKFFSSFPHGTCSLSVSRPYLALDEVYHPIWAALPSNSTLQVCVSEQYRKIINGTVTLSGVPFQETLIFEKFNRTFID